MVKKFKVEDPETGAEKEVVEATEVDTLQSELEKIKAEKEKIESDYKGRMDEFIKGKQSFELREKEIESKIEETKKLAEEAKNETLAERNLRLTAEKNSAIEQIAGDDLELKKKIEDEMEKIDSSKVSDVKERVKMAGSILGLNSNNLGGAFPMSGGYAPNFSPKKNGPTDAEHQMFKDALGLNDLLGKKEDK